MAFIVGMIIGLLIGGVVGFCLLAILQANRVDDVEPESFNDEATQSEEFNRCRMLTIEEVNISDWIEELSRAVYEINTVTPGSVRAVISRNKFILTVFKDGNAVKIITVRLSAEGANEQLRACLAYVLSLGRDSKSPEV